MSRVVLGIADQSLMSELRSILSEIDGIELTNVADSTPDVVTAVVRDAPDIVFVHDRLGPDPVHQVLRELVFRRPATAALVISAQPSAEALAAAMENGARGVVTYPFTYEDVRDRIIAASEWAAQMQRVISDASAEGRGAFGRAKVVAFVGAKGGVGTTTIATHLALDAVASNPGFRVCLVDLDLENSDVPGIIDVRHSVSIADLARVATDLSTRTIADAVVTHESGLDVLLPPRDVRDVELISQHAFREIFAALRQSHDLLIADAGSHLNPVQATVLEVADEVVLVVTPDVLCLRAFRRVITAWEDLGVRREQDVRVLVNRISRADDVQGEALRRIAQAPVVSAGLPAMFRRLEPAINVRDPAEVRDRVWTKAIRAIGHELALGPAPQAVTGVAAAELEGAGNDGRRSRLRRRSQDGAIAIETVAMVPTVIAILLLCWQVALVGLTFVWSGHAADAAGRALSVGRDPGPAARNAVPDGMRGNVSVDPDGADGSDRITVSVRAPLAAPGFAEFPITISATRSVVLEP